MSRQRKRLTVRGKGGVRGHRVAGAPAQSVRGRYTPRLRRIKFIVIADPDGQVVDLIAA